MFKTLYKNGYKKQEAITMIAKNLLLTSILLCQLVSSFILIRRILLPQHSVKTRLGLEQQEDEYLNIRRALFLSNESLNDYCNIPRVQYLSRTWLSTCQETAKKLANTTMGTVRNSKSQIVENIGAYTRTLKAMLSSTQYTKIRENLDQIQRFLFINYNNQTFTTLNNLDSDLIRNPLMLLGQINNLLNELLAS